VISRALIVTENESLRCQAEENARRHGLAYDSPHNDIERYVLCWERNYDEILLDDSFPFAEASEIYQTLRQHGSLPHLLMLHEEESPASEETGEGAFASLRNRISAYLGSWGHYTPAQVFFAGLLIGGIGARVAWEAIILPVTSELADTWGTWTVFALAGWLLIALFSHLPRRHLRLEGLLLVKLFLIVSLWPRLAPDPDRVAAAVQSVQQMISI
jgi:hypothetical protein